MPSEPFKNKIRLRVNGLLRRDDALLLVKLKSPITNELIWMPPGGGLQFGERMEECLIREFAEETGLEISVGSFAFINQIIKPPYHAVEWYYRVKKTGGNLHLGNDPELPPQKQLLKEVQWISVDELADLHTAPKKLKGWIT